MRQMKDSGVNWIGHIPNEWTNLRLKYLGKLYGGLTGKSREDFDIEEGDNYAYFIPFTNIFNNVEIDINKISKVKVYPLEKQNEVLKGDLLFLMSSEDVDGIGKCALLNTDKIRPLYLNSFCKGFRTNTSKVVPTYLNYLMDTVGRTYCRMFSNGFIRINLRQDKLENCMLPLPTLTEQQKIANYLDEKCGEADSLVSLQEEMISELQAYKQSVITEAVTHGLNSNAKMKDSNVQWIGRMPEHWESPKVKTFMGLVTTRSDKNNKIGLENIESFSGKFVGYFSDYEGNGIDVHVDDIVYGKLRPYLCKAWLATFECNAVGDFFVFRTYRANSFNNKFLNYVFLSDGFTKVCNASTFGAKMPRVSSDYILSLKFPMPPLIEQQQIATYLDTKCADIDELIRLKQQKIEELKEYKKSLIFECVTGKREIL